MLEGIDEDKLGPGKRIVVNQQVAQPAIQQATNLARNLRKLKAGIKPEKFQYRDKGSLATIGRHLAVADLGRLRF